MGVFLTLDEYNELKEQIEDTIAYLKAKLANDFEPMTPIREITKKGNVIF